MSGSEQRDSQVPQAEKQRTIRFSMVVVATVILGFGAMLILKQGTEEGRQGGVEVNVLKGTVSLTLNKPIVGEQVQLRKQTIRSEGSIVQFTEGSISNPSVVTQLQRLPSKPTQFAGKNFINRQAGFLLTVEHPESWMVSYNPAGEYNPAIPLNTISNSEGSNLNIGVSRIVQTITIQGLVAFNVQAGLRTGMIQQIPVVSYDLPSETAFAIFTNPLTRGQSFQKIIIDRRRDRVLVASANYNQYLSTPQAVQDLIKMIATFTIIGE